MGYCAQPTPEMGEYIVEVRSESFYLLGAPSFVWWRPAEGRSVPGQLREGDDIELGDEGVRPPGGGWNAGYVERRHGIFVYPFADTGQGAVELLIEDIPKIRAALDQAERIARGEKRDDE